MSDEEKLKLAIVRLERIGMGAGDYLYPDDDTYYVRHSDVTRVLRFLKGWDVLSWCSLCGRDDHADKRCTTKAEGVSNDTKLATPSQREEDRTSSDLEEILKQFIQKYMAGNLEQTYGEHKTGTKWCDEAIETATQQIQKLLEEAELRGYQRGRDYARDES